MTGLMKCCQSLLSVPSPYDLEYLIRVWVSVVVVECWDMNA